MKSDKLIYYTNKFVHSMDYISLQLQSFEILSFVLPSLFVREKNAYRPHIVYVFFKLGMTGARKFGS